MQTGHVDGSCAEAGTRGEPGALSCDTEPDDVRLIRGARGQGGGRWGPDTTAVQAAPQVRPLGPQGGEEREKKEGMKREVWRRKAIAFNCRQDLRMKCGLKSRCIKEKENENEGGKRRKRNDRKEEKKKDEKKRKKEREERGRKGVERHAG